MISNAKQLPAVYFGLHFCPGIAQYANEHRILINEKAAKKMDPTFEGKPVYVQHVNEVDLTNLEKEICGVVFDSFYNKSDGNHWVRFEIHSDAGHEAIKNGWKLSNAYVPTSRAGGGEWQGVQYNEEIMDGEYEHLALVAEPRYAQCMILTPKQFKEYNEKKEIELKMLTNSKEKPQMKLNLFKRTKVENAADLENTMVELPLSKVEMTITQIVNELDKVMNMHGYANDDHMVKMSDSKEMSVKELRDCYNDMMKKNEEVKEPVEGDALGEKEDGKMYPAKNEAEEDMPMQPQNSKSVVKKTSVENFKRIAEAPAKFANAEDEVVKVFDGVRRGKELFGSN